MLDTLKDFFRKAWSWVEALWDRHDEYLEEMVQSVLPMVIEVAFRPDLTGDAKKKAIVDAIVDNAETAVGDISHSLLNEAIELAAARYNIQIGRLTADRMEVAREAALKASRDFANKTLKITGTEAEDANISLNAPLTLDNKDVS